MKIALNDFQSYYKQHEAEYIATFKKTLNSGWFVLGREVELFEKEFAKYIGVKHCVGVANGLEALQISLLAHQIGPGDEVITTPLSAFATTLAIHAVGATPVFVDVTDDGLIDIAIIEKAITKKTKAVLPVHLYGNPLPLSQLRKICDDAGLILIEDAAQAQGTMCEGNKAGSIGNSSCFSFYPTKNLGALGDGGAIVTNDPSVADVCRSLRDYGQDKKYVHTKFGLNSRLDELQAALLRIRLKYLDADNTKRVDLSNGYRDLLEKRKTIDLLSPSKGGNSHLCVIKVAKRDSLKTFLAKKGVETAVHYPLIIPDQPVYKGIYQLETLPIARHLSSHVLTIPCHPNLTKQNIQYVCNSILEYFDT